MMEPSASVADAVSGKPGQTASSPKKRGRPASGTIFPDQSKNDELTRSIQAKEEAARVNKIEDKPLETVIYQDVIRRVKSLSNFNFAIEDFNGWRVALMKIQEAVRDYG